MARTRRGLWVVERRRNDGTWRPLVQAVHFARAVGRRDVRDWAAIYGEARRFRLTRYVPEATPQRGRR